MHERLEQSLVGYVLAATKKNRRTQSFIVNDAPGELMPICHPDFEQGDYVIVLCPFSPTPTE